MAVNLAAVVHFIAENEPLVATQAAFPDVDPVQMRRSLALLAKRLAARAAVAAVADDAPARVATPPVSRVKPAGAVGHKMVVYSDGASRGNPGLSGAGWVILGADGQIIGKGGLFLGKRTNNEAEYLAAAMGLQAAYDLQATDVVLRADSELMVRQLAGRYQVKNERLRPLYNEVMKVARAFSRFKAEHVPRAQNAAADEQANLAIDER